MTEGDFDRARRLLRERGYDIVRAETGGFGSWAVTIRTPRGLMVAFDGRDGWLYVSQGRALDDIRGWHDVWQDREPTADSLDRALSVLADYAANEGYAPPS